MGRLCAAAQIQDSSEVTMGGIMLPEAAREKPIAGTVVAVGPGKREKDGTRKKPTVRLGFLQEYLASSQPQGIEHTIAAAAPLLPESLQAFAARCVPNHIHGRDALHALPGVQ